MSERSASSSREPHAQACGYNREVHAAPIPERRRDAKGEGSPDRGSSAPFTRCEVSRSRLDGKRVFFIVSARVRRATGVSDVARDSRLGGKITPVSSECRDHRSAQRRREPPSAPVLTPQGARGRGNRTDQGARLIRGIGQKSVVRIFGSSISLALQGVCGATGGSSDDGSHANCERSRTGIARCRSAVDREVDR
jgi:hypothetical protein